MFKFFILISFLISFSGQAMDLKLNWDDRELGIGLHVFAKGKDQSQKDWTVREAQIKDTEFYQNLLGNPEVTKTMQDGEVVPVETAAIYVENWVERFTNGIPYGRMTIVQDEEPIGCVQLGQSKTRPGVGEICRAFIPSAQGRGLGKAVLGFLVQEWAPAIRKIALNQDSKAPSSAVDKFKCFGGEELKLIYTTARPSNVASWKCYKYFDFVPSQPTDKTHQISCDGWEPSSYKSLENYIVHKYFSSFSVETLQADILYDMVDENGESRTLSYMSNYKSLRYHFEHIVN